MSQAKSKKAEKHHLTPRTMKEHPAHFSEFYLDQLMRGHLPRTRDFLFNASFQFSRSNQAPEKNSREPSGTLRMTLRQNAVAAHVEYGAGISTTEALMLVHSMMGVTALTYAALGFRSTQQLFAAGEEHQDLEPAHRKGKGKQV